MRYVVPLLFFSLECLFKYFVRYVVLIFLRSLYFTLMFQADFFLGKNHLLIHLKCSIYSLYLFHLNTLVAPVPLTDRRHRRALSRVALLSVACANRRRAKWWCERRQPNEWSESLRSPVSQARSGAIASPKFAPAGRDAFVRLARAIDRSSDRSSLCYTFTPDLETRDISLFFEIISFNKKNT